MRARWCSTVLVAIVVATMASPATADGFFAWKTKKFLAKVEAANQDMERRFQAQQDCCAGFRDMSFKAPSGARTRVELGPDAPIFTFAEGRAKFQAFALPILKAGDKLALVMVERIPHTPTPRIRPMLVLLSDRYEVLTVFAPAAFEEGRIGLADEGKKASLTIDDALSAARYAVVAADPRWAGKQLDLEARSGVVNYGVVAVGSSTPAISLPYGREGRTYFYVDTH